MAKYSIIVPTLNEEENIPKLLSHLKNFNENIEIIISDGGSTDNTLNLLKNFDVIICHGKPGRGLQLNEGTKYAKGKILIYLHADTFLPQNAFNLISDFFLNRENGIATFTLSFDSSSIFMRAYCWLTKFDSLFTTFGDQTIVINKNLFNNIGGFSNIKLYEDVDFFRKARKTINIYKFPAAVATSARRFNKKGIIFTQLFNIYYFILYLLKVNPDIIYKKYYNAKL